VRADPEHVKQEESHKEQSPFYRYDPALQVRHYEIVGPKHVKQEDEHTRQFLEEV
jgi:hypothetical protein